MTPTQIAEVFKTHWKPGWGSVAADEAEYIQRQIATHKPKSFVEIGMASGLSAGLIARFMDENEGERLVTVDHDDTFFGDKNKKNGFLIEAIYPGGRVAVSKMPFKTALDIPSVGGTFEMAFVDANHQHPWPIIDTLCLHPFMTGSRICIHHDLNLFLNQEIVFGIGPKYLYDQFPARHRDRSDANSGNIFLVSLDVSREEIARIAASAFSLPWSLRTPIQEVYVTRIRSMLREYHEPWLSEVFDRCLKKFNILDRFRSGL
ncbi:MAG: class I SAM-dependent methyltransferase [Aurantimonas endophytica]|uniref:class I SAM-dependent methyltransferase n=1 Tax=Aurantimonas endophytica TaxID=1522175 RepID=UPI003002BC7A